MAAGREARRAAEWRQEEEERAREAALARADEHQYPLPSYIDVGIIEDAQHRRRQAHEDLLRCCRETGNRGGSVPATDGAGSSGGQLWHLLV
jgi:hypothetical protein